MAGPFKDLLLRLKIKSKIGSYYELEKFNGTFIVSEFPENVFDILNHWARNTVNIQFIDIKKLFKNCDYKDCLSIGKIEACHINQERKDILMDAIKTNEDDGIYDVFKIMEQFKREHENAYPENIRFLCKKHHFEMDKETDKQSYIKQNLKEPITIAI